MKIVFTLSNSSHADKWIFPRCASALCGGPSVVAALMAMCVCEMDFGAPHLEITHLNAAA
jgi:hypothetical protein